MFVSLKVVGSATPNLYSGQRILGLKKEELVSEVKIKNLNTNLYHYETFSNKVHVYLIFYNSQL